MDQVLPVVHRARGCLPAFPSDQLCSGVGSPALDLKIQTGTFFKSVFDQPLKCFNCHLFCLFHKYFFNGHKFCFNCFCYSFWLAIFFLLLKILQMPHSPIGPAPAPAPCSASTGSGRWVTLPREADWPHALHPWLPRMYSVPVPVPSWPQQDFGNGASPHPAKRRQWACGLLWLSTWRGSMYKDRPGS